MSNIKKKTNKIKIFPKTVQETIPITAVHFKENIIETEPGIFTKSYRLQDTNYQTANEEDQEKMFLKYCDLLNSFDNKCKVSITINNKNINQDDFERNVLIKEIGDDKDTLRMNFNEMLYEKISEGKNNIIKDKYITVSVSADDVKKAAHSFLTLETAIKDNIKAITKLKDDINCLTIEERLEILHDIYNVGHEGEFSAKTKIDGKEVSSFDDNFSKQMGLSVKDLIAPSSFSFNKPSFFLMGNKFCRALSILKYPTSVQDDFIAELTNTDFNMITAINIEPVQQDKALKIVNTNLININANVQEAEKKATKNGYSPESISYDLKRRQAEANELMGDLTSKNQKMFFLNISCLIIADTLEELNAYTESVRSICRKYLFSLQTLTLQQEYGLNACLPLCVNNLKHKRTLTTQAVAVFMPFNALELTEKTGMYYSLNAITKNMVIYDRKKGNNYNGWILGCPGSGKSFTAKREMLSVFLSRNADVIVIDPEAEYYPLAKILGGEIIRITPGGEFHINPFDMNEAYGADEENPLVAKTDFIVSLCNIVAGGMFGLSAVQKSIIERCVRRVYRPYVEHNLDQNYLPTLVDFQRELLAQRDPEAREIAVAFEQFTDGSFNTFAYKTNVKTNSRFIVYDIKNIGSNIRGMAMSIILDSIWNRICANRQTGRETWFYVDEAHLLLKEEDTAKFLRDVYKRARKYNGIPTSMTQNVSDILSNPIASTMLSNSNFIQMLNQAPLDRADLSTLLNISQYNQGFITSAGPGQGLIYTGSTIIPIKDAFPQDNPLYKVLTSNPEEIQRFKEEEARRLAKESKISKTS